MKRQLFTDPKKEVGTARRGYSGKHQVGQEADGAGNVDLSLRCDFPGKGAAGLSWSFRTSCPEFAPAVRACLVTSGSS